jgi:hypothetical protein
MAAILLKSVSKRLQQLICVPATSDADRTIRIREALKLPSKVEIPMQQQEIFRRPSTVETYLRNIPGEHRQDIARGHLLTYSGHAEERTQWAGNFD